MRLRSEEIYIANPMEQMLLSIESNLNKIESRLDRFERDDQMETLDYSLNLSTLRAKAERLRNIATDPLHVAHASELLEVTLAIKESASGVVMGYLNRVSKELALKMANMTLPKTHDKKMLFEGFLTDKELESAVPYASYAPKSTKKKTQK
jgi:hypothetical protein